MMQALEKNSFIHPDQQKFSLWKVLSRIQKNWNFSNAEMARLLHLKPNTYGNWINQQSVPLGKPPYSPEIEIVINFIAIYRGLGGMFTSFADQLAWLEAPHPDLNKISPLEYIKQSCGNIFRLRTYLDYIRGRGA